ncbi:MAG: MBL fold metallo-hydrolase [Chloroflexi bacterium]|nr:MBL fold metallo-hydrolase [Chloroflexota bacterium]
MRLHFLGAATTVTGSQMLLETDGAKILIDCGMFQGNPHDVARNRVPFAYDPATLDALLLTHAHLDHCGLIPHLVAEGFKGPIYATRGTVELATLVLLDSGKLQEEFSQRHDRFVKRHPDRAAREHTKDQAALDAAMAEARDDVRDDIRDPEEALRAQPPQVALSIDEPLYDQEQARRSLERFRGIEYDKELEVAPGIRATFLDAGHILGSSIIRLEIEPGGSTEGNAPRLVVVFSGDLGRNDTPIIRDPTVVTDADYVVVESTYGGREHEPHAEAIRLLTEAVRMVADAKGVLLVPSFAIGRTQEVVWELDRLIEAGAIPKLPLYLDSPMASKATDVYRRFTDYYDEETRKLVEARHAPLDYPDAHITNDPGDSSAIASKPRPYLLVASNGMLTGGRVVGHLRELVGDPSAVILFVGYQGQGTLGAQLQAGATNVSIEGQPFEVRCRIRSISGFSAHADEPELLAWLKHFAGTGRTKRVFLVHGDPPAQAALEPKVRSLGLDVLVPHWRQAVELP